MSKILKEWVMHYHPFTQHVRKTLDNELIIGFGRNLTTQGIAFDEAETLLVHDLHVLKKQLRKFVWYIDQPEQIKNALIHLAYSMGLNKLLQEKELLRFLKNHDYTQASLTLLESNWGR